MATLPDLAAPSNAATPADLPELDAFNLPADVREGLDEWYDQRAKIEGEITDAELELMNQACQREEWRPLPDLQPVTIVVRLPDPDLIPKPAA